MFDLKTYLSSGVIEAYCLGNLSLQESTELLHLAQQHPEIDEEINITLATLKRHLLMPNRAATLKERVLDFLLPHLDSELIDPQHLPLLHPFSSSVDWHNALGDQTPDLQEENFAIRVLKDTPDVQLHMVWLFHELVEDGHPSSDFQESFLILEGACECNFGGRIVRFSAGDYFEIPPDTQHIIRNITPDGCVRGLVQRKKVA